MLRSFPIYPPCPVCGDPEVNPNSLGVRWFWDEDERAAVGHFVPGPLHCGYANQVHGGVIATLLDECLAWACAVEFRAYCVTGDLQVRYKAPAVLGERITLRAVAGERWERYVRARGEVRSSEGRLIATATARFAALSREQSLALRAALRFEAGDVDILADEPT